MHDSQKVKYDSLKYRYDIFKYRDDIIKFTTALNTRQIDKLKYPTAGPRRSGYSGLGVGTTDFSYPPWDGLPWAADHDTVLGA